MATDYRFWNESSRRYQEEKKEEGTAKTDKRKVKPDSSWCYQRKAGLMRSMEFDLPRVRGAHGECEGAGSSGSAEDRKRSRSSTPRSRLSMEEDASLGDL